MTNPGKYRHLITFQKYDGTVDDYGDVRTDISENWDDFKTVWAAIDPISGKEFYAAEQSQSEVTHKVRCRYIAGIKAEMRIKYGNRLFKILSVIDWEERHEAMLIMAKEMVE